MEPIFINRTVVTKKYILCKGGFSNLIGTIQDRQLISTKNNILVPFYTVIVSGGQKVYESYAVMQSKPISLIALFYWFVMNINNMLWYSKYLLNE